MPKQKQIFTPVATLVTGAQIPEECAMHSEPVAQLPRDEQFYERVKQAMQTCTTDELKVLISLPSSLRTDSDMGDEPYWYPATKHCASLEICATLVGQKPCTLFTTTASDPKIYLGLVESVWKPFFDKLHLERYGFVLQRAENAFDVEFGGGGEAWVLADTRSDQ